jgi:hypothetical protein
MRGKGLAAMFRTCTEHFAALSVATRLMASFDGHFYS